jgi:outer membrane lipase/esterase
VASLNRSAKRGGINVKALRNLALVAVLAAAALGTSATAQPKVAYQALFVFGDSLADTGNDFILTTAAGINPAIPPSVSPHQTYYQGRFSNGPTEFEYLWSRIQQGPQSVLTPFLATQQLALAPCPAAPFVTPTELPKKGAVNFAFGGSGTAECTITGAGFAVPGLRTQVKWLGLTQDAKFASKKTLYAILSGSNDYLATPPADPHVVVDNITNAVKDLSQLGARDIMVLNVPDLGSVPLNAPLPPPVRATLSGLSSLHNVLLKQSLDALVPTLPDDTKVILVDLHGLVEALSGNPSFVYTTPALPFPNSVCLFTNPATCTNVPTFDVEPKFVFWDALHPTTATHSLLSEFLYDALQASN